MKKTLLFAAALGFSLSASAQTATLLGGFDFNEFTADGAVYVPDESGATQSIIAAYSDVSGDRSHATGITPGSPRVSMVFDGTSGSDSFNADFGDEGFEATAATFSGTTSVNQVINTATRQIGQPQFGVNFDSAATTGPTNASNSLYLSPIGTDNTFAFKIDASGYQSLSLSYAGYFSGGSAMSIAWSYSLNDGIDSISTGVTSTLAQDVAALQTVDLSGISDLDNQSNIVLLGTLTPTGGAAFFIDNVQVLAASAIPEPGSAALWAGLIVTGLVASRRRRAVRI